MHKYHFFRGKDLLKYFEVHICVKITRRCDTGALEMHIGLTEVWFSVETGNPKSLPATQVSKMVLSKFLRNMWF